MPQKVRNNREYIINVKEMKMLTTKELEEYIKNEISNKVVDVNWSLISYIEGNEKSKEGTYVFSKNNAYHILLVEKGKVRDNNILVDLSEILLRVLDIYSFDIAMQYAINNRLPGRDFRHLLFEKEIEIFSLFGEEFRKHKVKEIETILKKAPYIDEIVI